MGTLGYMSPGTGTWQGRRRAQQTFLRSAPSCTRCCPERRAFKVIQMPTQSIAILKDDPPEFAQVTKTGSPRGSSGSFAVAWRKILANASSRRETSALRSRP